MTSDRYPGDDVGSADMERLNLRIPDDLKAAIEREVERQETVSMSEFVRTAIVSYLRWLDATRGKP
jgi:Arc/MetJ-type ribon-helix-helix transcriptional regulator